MTIPPSTPAAPRDRRALWLGLGAAGVVALVVLLVVVLTGRETPPPDEPEEPDEEPEEPDEEPTATWPLTGLPADPLEERPALLVKVSNSPEARPQTALDRADVVYEELTEGGITRFLAVFHSDVPEVIGPVRSARPVDTQVVPEYDRPGFAYSGAREEVRALLAAMAAVTITEGGAGFFRDDGTYASTPVAPHNLFVRGVDALPAITDAGAEPLGPRRWVFDDEPPDGAVDGDAGSDVEVVMSQAFTTSWRYDAAAGRYRRSQNDVPSEVTGDGRIGAANVVVLEVRHYVGDSGFPETDVLGQGPAVILRDGRWYAARWSKSGPTGQLELLTEAGAAFPLKPGPTWIHLPDTLPAPPVAAGDGTR